MASRRFPFFYFLFLHVAPLAKCSSAERVVTVALDGTGDFRTITEAIEIVPSKSSSRTTIVVGAGVYHEYLVVPPEKVNLTLQGAGSGATIITGNRSHAGGWSTLDSATVSIEAAGFAALDLTFQNSAGIQGGQAVALNVHGGTSAFYRCVIDGYQDTLFAQSGRQFYRGCTILGTVDFIFGNAAAVFQDCVISPRGSRGGTITAQSRQQKKERKAFSFHRCVVEAIADADSGEEAVKPESFYLGRPWRPYASVVFLKTFMSDVINPKGWVPWDGPSKPMPPTIYYGEFENFGPGAAAAGRVKLEGVKQIGKAEASWFTVGALIAGDSWIPATNVPFDSNL
ncbi:hypothetical protein HPP92_012887 [Vanilla planifolia]|uniref:Pectinesterase n=1 Tax=Vanilla planifolia TaxID=51239 RepID=A0A835QUL8_VANPL|nr:hypothetical protein HPP92_012887 [Vanilla planifolia]